MSAVYNLSLVTKLGVDNRGYVDKRFECFLGVIYQPRVNLTLDEGLRFGLNSYAENFYYITSGLVFDVD